MAARVWCSKCLRVTISSAEALRLVVRVSHHCCFRMRRSLVTVIVEVPNKRPAIPVGRREPVHGFGAQLNTFVFTDAGTGFKHEGTGQTQNLTPAQRRVLKDAVCEAAPGHCRVFVRGLDPDSPNAPAFRAFLDTIEMADAAGAKTVNLTWWGGPYADRQRLAALKWPNDGVLTGWPRAGLRKWPDELTKPDGPNGMPGPRNQMRRFARIVHIARKAFPCVTHATIQNEPNGSETDIARKGVPNLSMRLYEHLYRAFADALAELDDPQREFPNLRKAVTIVAGDLLRDGKGKDGADSQTRGSSTSDVTWMIHEKVSRACSTRTRSTSIGNLGRQSEASFPISPRSGSTISPSSS